MGSSLVLSLALVVASGLPAIAVSENLNGDFVSTACGRPEKAPPTLLRVAAEFEAWPDALRIDVGNVLGSAAVGELITQHDPNGVARALQLLDLKAVALGRRDLATARAPLVATAKSLKAAKLPFIASNLTCDASAKNLCLELVTGDSPTWLIDTPDGSIGVVSALAPGVFDSIAPDRREGLQLTDPKAALEHATHVARANGARWVVAIYEGAHGHELDDSLALAGQLAASYSRPDVLLALHLAGRVGVVDTPTVLPLTVVAPVPGHATRVWPVRVEAEVPTRRIDAESPLALWSKSTGQWLCENLASPTHAWPLKRSSLEALEVSMLLLDALRERARAEVAIVNRNAVRPPERILQNLTALDVATTLPYDNSVMTTSLPGSELKKIFEGDESKHELLIRGLSRNEKGDVLLNGRPLEGAQPYLVVTNDYLASGGDGVFVDKAVHFEPLLGTTARRVWLEQLARRLEAKQPADDPIDDPANRTRWLFRATADLSFSFVRVVNPASNVYTDSQLSRSSAVAFRGDVEVRADADHTAYTWENGMRLRYGLSRTGVEGDETALNETDDLMYLRDTVTVRRGLGSRFVPFAESYLESEFTAPTTRAYHHLEWRPITGGRVLLLPELSLFAGLGLDWETLAREGQRGVTEPVAAFVLVGGAALRPRALFSLGQVPVTGEGSLDVSWRDPANSSSALVRLRAKVSIPVVQALALTVAYDLFARHSGAAAGSWGFANDVVIGLSFRWAQPFQGYVF